MLAVLGLVGFGRLPQDLGDLGLDLVEGAVGLVGGVGGQLGAVQRNHTQPHQPGGGAQLERGDQQAGQGLLVAGAEAGDGYMVGGLVAGQHPKGEVLAAAPLDLAGGTHADGVGVQQHAKQGLGVVGGVAVPVGPVAGIESGQVQLVDHVQHEPSQVFGWQPVAQAGRQQEGLVAVAPQKVVGHAEYYLFAALSPMILVLKGP